jgi:hypothetical protein
MKKLCVLLALAAVLLFGSVRSAEAGSAAVATFTGFNFPDYSIGLVLGDTVSTIAYANLVNYVDANIDLPSAEYQWGNAAGCSQAFSYTQDNSPDNRKCRLFPAGHRHDKYGLSWTIASTDFSTCNAIGNDFDLTNLTWHGETLPTPFNNEAVVYNWQGARLVLNEKIGTEVNALHLYLPGKGEVRVGHIQGE